MPNHGALVPSTVMADCAYFLQTRTPNGIRVLTLREIALTMKFYLQHFWGLMLFGLAGTCAVPNALAQQLGPAPLPPVTYANFQDEEAAEEVADEEEEDDLDFLDQDLDEIRNTQVAAGAMSQEIESVSRTAQPLARTAAAVYVVNNEMIKRSGARNIPEVLRTVPGINVARVTSTVWAISIRGFNTQYANKLLVQIDGRAIYTPLFAGVYWDQNRVLLKDVERIEIIRGPGGTVWGANAVNGIINIVTKSSTDTTGFYAEIGGGDEHRMFSGVRVGGQLSQNLTYRIYGLHNEDDPGYLTGGNSPDGMVAGQGGFRVDWTPTCCDTFTMQGDFSNGTVDYTEPTDASTANALVRWSHTLTETSDWSVQMYYDQFDRSRAGAGFVGGSQIGQEVFDLDTQYHTQWRQDHDIVCGFGFRNYSTRVVTTPGATAVEFNPPRDNFDIISYFVQDTMTLVDDRLYTTLGCKFEHNDFTGFEYQPTAKLVWTPDERTSVWGSFSRAVRTPSVADRDMAVTIGPVAAGPTFMRYTGSRNTVSEDVLSYEFGLRRQPTDKFYWDLAAFFNRYDNLVVTQSFGTTVGPPNFIENGVVNRGRADTYGFEWLGTYEVAPWWNVRGGYSFFIEHQETAPGTSFFVVEPGYTPRNQVYFHSGWDLNCCTTFDMSVRYVDSLQGGVPRYIVADLRLGWEPAEGLEFALVAQNLMDDHHPEFASSTSTVTEVESGFYGMVSYEY